MKQNILSLILALVFVFAVFTMIYKKKFGEGVAMRAKKNPLLFLILAFFVLSIFASCSSEEQTPPTASGKIDIDDTSGVVIKDKIDQQNPIKKASLGSVTYKTDKTNSVTEDFLTDGNVTTLELTDSSGIKWTLNIPPNALMYPQKITMTCLTDIKSSSFPGELSGGVYFEPDGLHFLEPATLTVSGKGIAGNSLLLEGNGDGSELDYAIPGQSGDGRSSSYIYHFSTAFVLENPQLKELYDNTEKEYKAAIKTARELKKKPLEITAPPSFDFRCKTDKDVSNEPVDAYISQLINPEQNVIARIIKAKRTLLILGVDEKDLECDGYLQDLTRRQLKKVNMLIRNYKYQYDKYLYVSSTILSVAKQGALFEIIDHDAQDAYLSIIQEWCNEARKYYLSELTGHHDYKSISAACLFTRYTALYTYILSNHPEDSDEAMNRLVKELQNACTFKIAFTGTETSFGGDSGTTSWSTEGEAMVTLANPGIFNYEITPDALRLDGNGKGIHTSYKTTDPATAKVLLTKGFHTETALVPRTICFNRVKAGIRYFGAHDKLQYQLDDGNVFSIISFYKLTELLMPNYYDEQLKMTAVDMELTPGQAVFEGEIHDRFIKDSSVENDSESSYTITLEHKPQ